VRMISNIRSFGDKYRGSYIDNFLKILDKIIEKRLTV